MEEFIIFIKAIVGVDEIDLKLILSKCRERKVAKGKFILKRGQIATQYFFRIKVFYSNQSFTFYSALPEHADNAAVFCFSIDTLKTIPHGFFV